MFGWDREQGRNVCNYRLSNAIHTFVLFSFLVRWKASNLKDEGLERIDKKAYTHISTRLFIKKTKPLVMNPLTAHSFCVSFTKEENSRTRHEGWSLNDSRAAAAHTFSHSTDNNKEANNRESCKMEWCECLRIVWWKEEWLHTFSSSSSHPSQERAEKSTKKIFLSPFLHTSFNLLLLAIAILTTPPQAHTYSLVRDDKEENCE